MFNSVYVQQMHITLELGTEFYTVTERTYICQKDFFFFNKKWSKTQTLGMVYWGEAKPVSHFIFW